MESASDHQVKDEPVLVIHADGDSFTEAAESADGFAVDPLDRRHGGAQQEWVADADLFQSLSENPLLKRFDVDGDVRQFGHGGEDSCWKLSLQTRRAEA